MSDYNTVLISGYALEFASEELKNDRETVLAAVQKNGGALEYASERLRDDREIVLAAVQQNALALQHASERLRNDREIVLAAVKQMWEDFVKLNEQLDFMDKQKVNNDAE